MLSNPAGCVGRRQRTVTQPKVAIPVRVEGPLPAEESTARDEGLLAEGAPSVRVAILADRSISLGVGVSSHAPLLARLRASGVPVVRRGSGGTGVLHEPGDLTWAIILPRSDPRVGRGFVRAYARLGAGPVALLRSLGAPAEWVPAPGLATEYCPLGDRGEVLAVAGRVVGGAAQHLTSRALLHHGFVSFEIDRGAIDRLFGLASPGPTRRLTGLRELGIRLEPAELAHRLAERVAESLGPIGGRG
jgi:lipoate-protein ligase A